MGFSVLWQGDGMAGIQRDGITFNVVENDNRVWADNASFSIGVSDLEALYQEYRGIPARVGPLSENPGAGLNSISSFHPVSACSSTNAHERLTTTSESSSASYATAPINAEAELVDDRGRIVGRGSGSFMRSAIPLSPEVGYA